MPLDLAVDKAQQQLCSGDYHGASTAFAALLPQMEQRTGDGDHWIDYALGYFYAMLAAGDGAGARRFLTSVEQNYWKPETADRLYWNGEYADSLAAYIADDGEVTRTPDDQAQHKLDPHLPIALSMLRANNLDGAIAAINQVSDQQSLYFLMRGNLYGEKRDWSSAANAWISAADAGPGMIEMEFSSFDRWNLTALEMLYYYRAHIPQ